MYKFHPLALCTYVEIESMFYTVFRIIYIMTINSDLKYILNESICMFI